VQRQEPIRRGALAAGMVSCPADDRRDCDTTTNGAAMPGEARTDVLAQVKKRGRNLPSMPTRGTVTPRESNMARKRAQVGAPLAGAFDSLKSVTVFE